MHNQVHRVVAAGAACWWTTAVLKSSNSPDEAMTHCHGEVLLRQVDTPQPGGLGQQSRVRSGVERSTWGHTWGWLRRRGAEGLRLVVPAPGDPLGLPGPSATNRAAMASGIALISVGGEPVVLIGEQSGLWRAYPAHDDPAAASQLGSRSEVRRAMREAMAVVTSAMSSAALEPDAVALASLAEMRRTSVPEPPASVHPDDVALVGSAIRVWQLTLIAASLADRRSVSLDRDVVEVGRWSRRAVAVGFSPSPDRNR